MKHPVSREFFTYWESKRGEARAPERADVDPSALRELLGDIFVLSYDDAATYPFRVAGTRICALFGGDVKDRSFPALFSRQHRRDISDIIAAVAEDVVPAVAGLTATLADGRTTHLELLLLPFNSRAHCPITLTGVLAPFETDHVGVLADLALTSWRYIHPPQQKLMPRALRKLAIARGFMVYEGLS
jgi:hypothetical protein